MAGAQGEMTKRVLAALVASRAPPDHVTAPLDVYVPVEQSPFPAGDLVVRTRGLAAPAVQSIRAALRELHRDGVVSVALMEQEVAAHQAPWRTSLVLFGAFAALTILLAVVGVYAMLNAAVAERTRDVGVRIALGATARRILGQVLADGGRVVGVGLMAGVLATAAVARLVATLLFDVSPLDVATLAAALVLVAATGLLACAIPAVRAARLDPSVTLRAE